MTTPRLLAMLTAAALAPTACALSTDGVPQTNGFGSTGGAGSGAATSTSSTSTSTTTSSTSSTSTSGSGASSTSTSGSGASSTSTTTSTSSSSGATCATQTCEALPGGWTLVYARGVAAATPPDACSNGTTATIYNVGPAGAPTCASCQCDAPQGSACSAPQITCSYTKSDCSGSDAVFKATSTACYDLPNVPAADAAGSCQLTGPATLTTAGSCAATGGSMQTSPMWSGGVRVCDVTAGLGGCTGNAVCLPAGGSDGSLCITKAGNDTCPAGWTAQAYSTFSSGTDSRACTSCSCQVTCQGGGYAVHDLNGCAVSTLDFMVTSATCASQDGVFDQMSASLEPTLATPTQSCSGGTPTGQVTGNGPQQVCCR